MIVIDSRRCLSLIYDSSDLYPITLSSSSVFHCAGTEPNKVKIVDLHELFRHRRKYEISDEVEREIFALLRGSALRINLRTIISLLIA